MNAPDKIQYERIAAAIDFMSQNFKSQPQLEEVAAHLSLSPFHFQKLFTDWAGVSPKKFLQYISVEHAKWALKEKGLTLFDAALETGLSGTGRLHDLFVKIEGMTPGEYKNGGEDLRINYSFYHSPFGEMLMASTTKGICSMAFIETEEEGMTSLYNQFPKARLIEARDELQQNAVSIFANDWKELRSIKLHLKGTPFQLKVWEALLKVPMGKLTTYGKIANEIQNDKASRAVGTAIGSNPIAFLIPCHRVIQSTGITGGYMWGPTRKRAIIAWEAAKASLSDNL
jgi:AraC family transcriptional regulator, regulatory protein of adaptative response / methylated-DNA-[protein]-cysteine methyltransferase